MSTRVYPSVRYHKEHGSVVINNEAQHEKLDAEGWADTPAAFNPPESEKQETPKEKLARELSELESETEQVPEEDSIKASPGEPSGDEPSEDDVRETLIERGWTKKQLKNKSLEELKALLAE